MSHSLQTTVYFDCFSGISGDMVLGALLDAGLPLQHLKNNLAHLGLESWQIQSSKHQKQGGIAATSLQIHLEGDQPYRSWRNIRSLIQQSSELSEGVRQRSLAIFSCLAKAEAAVHGCSPEEVHFHEVGALDSLLDVVGAAIGFEYFSVNRLYASPLPYNRGWLQCDHGALPLPAPAVCVMLDGIPVEECYLQQELVTPTGLAILKGSGCRFETLPAMTIQRIGHGAGTLQRQDHKPNLLRVVIGVPSGRNEEEIEVLETNIDDWSPESFPYVAERLLQGGALDVALSQVLMKKGRPGFHIQVLAPPEKAGRIQEILFTETTTLGVRSRRERRAILSRTLGSIQTPFGPLQVKRVEGPFGLRFYPEYESCRALATKHDRSIQEMYVLAAHTSDNDFTALEPQHGDTE